MAAFLYFFPAKITTPHQFPPECGLESVFKDASCEVREVTGSGPAGHSGTIFAILPNAKWGGTLPRVGYFPDEQEWRQIRGADNKPTHWLGWAKDYPPRPEDLIRQRAPGGHVVELGDGNRWIIPAVQAVTADKITLPQVMELDGAGDLSLRVKPGYEDLVTESAWWWDVATKGGTYTFGRYWNYASALLGVVYRLGRAEINSLGLLLVDPVQREAVIGASLGLPDLAAQDDGQKKTVLVI